MTKLKVIETLPEMAGTTWTKMTKYEDRRPVFVQVWADNIIITQIMSDRPPIKPKTP